MLIFIILYNSLPSYSLIWALQICVFQLNTDDNSLHIQILVL